MDFQTIATSALAATIAAVALNQAVDWQRRGSRARAQLRGILLELAHAQHCIERFEGKSASPGYVTPVYRIATQFLGSSIEGLAAAGALKQAEAEQLHRFYIESDETNKALDAIAVFSISQPHTAEQIEALREFLGAASFTQLAEERFSRLREDLPAARAAAEAALDRIAWFEPQN